MMLGWRKCRFGSVVTVAAVFAMSSAGCGTQLKTIPVLGKVTFNGGPPPAPVFITFMPLEDGVNVGTPQPGAAASGRPPSRVGGAPCSADGSFTAACFRERTGLLPGRYEVRVSCFVDPGGANPEPKSFVPKDFNAPDLVVPAEARSVRYDLDVPSAAKRKK